MSHSSVFSKLSLQTKMASTSLYAGSHKAVVVFIALHSSFQHILSLYCTVSYLYNFLDDWYLVLLDSI